MAIKYKEHSCGSCMRITTVVVSVLSMILSISALGADKYIRGEADFGCKYKNEWHALEVKLYNDCSGSMEYQSSHDYSDYDDLKDLSDAGEKMNTMVGVAIPMSLLALVVACIANKSCAPAIGYTCVFIFTLVANILVSSGFSGWWNTWYEKVYKSDTLFNGYTFNWETSLFTGYTSMGCAGLAFVCAFGLICSLCCCAPKPVDDNDQKARMLNNTTVTTVAQGNFANGQQVQNMGFQQQQGFQQQGFQQQGFQQQSFQQPQYDQKLGYNPQQQQQVGQMQQPQIYTANVQNNQNVAQGYPAL